MSVRCGSSACESGADARQAAIKRLSEMSFTTTSRRKKYVESCTMLYRAAAQLDTCTITASTPNTTPRSTFLPKFSDNNQHCHCPLAADCYVRAAAVYLSKLKQSDMQYQSLILAAQLLITCKRTPDPVSGYERLMEADAQRQAAGLTDRELHTQLATLLNTVSSQLWTSSYYQRSIRALEISLSCYTRAIASHWTSELSDELHSIRVRLADRHVEYAIMLQTKAVSPAQTPGDTLPPKIRQQDHFQRGKELYEQAARYFPGRYLLRREISKAYGLHKNAHVCELIAGYAVEREWIVLCLFRASLSDLIICNRDNTMPPRVIDKPRILNKYCSASRSFVQSPECRLIRAVGGLLHLSTILPVPISFVEKDKRILQAWMNELLHELHNVIATYNDQTTLSIISRKMLDFIEIQVCNNVAEFDTSNDYKQNGG